ncbi:MAG: putative Transcriptional regulator TrmB [Promethearchaeota archaeon]|nr:MAG: putative Transcriptional regulator TrmB [Candidatus Lokiarchaeota archaeon]
MSDKLLNELREFLNDANLSTYEINAYITLLKASKTNPPTARKISKESGVPSGRIYETLNDLKIKGLIEIIEARPKKFKALSFNKSLDNLINYHSTENKRKIDYLYDRAKILESELYSSDFPISKEPSKLFWSTIYGTASILAVYTKYINSATQEIILNEFVNKSTVKILPHANLIYNPIKMALERGVKVKDLWSFEYDERPLTKDQKENCNNTFRQIQQIQKELYQLSSDLPNFEMKFNYHRMPSNFDIFDRKRILFKLQNPLKPYQIFSCMNVVDPNLAEELRSKFLSIWMFEAVELNS